MEQKRAEHPFGCAFLTMATRLLRGECTLWATTLLGDIDQIERFNRRLPKETFHISTVGKQLVKIPDYRCPGLLWRYFDLSDRVGRLTTASSQTFLQLMPLKKECDRNINKLWSLDSPRRWQTEILLDWDTSVDSSETWTSSDGSEMTHPRPVARTL